jgi:catechol 2,3-dioxygenase-like lactoylglutathione lyase family enzyme
MATAGGFSWQGLHHVGFIVDDLERSRGFYQGVLGAYPPCNTQPGPMPYDDWERAPGRCRLRASFVGLCGW